MCQWAYCYSPITGTTFSMDLSFFLFFDLILSFQTSNYEEILHKNSLISCPSHFTTHVCLMANLMPSNLTLFLTVHLCAVHGYATTYMHITCFMLLFHSATTMHLHHATSILICLSQTVSIDLVQTCTCNMIVYKIQGIDWHSQSDSLGDFPSKADSFNSITC